VIDADWSTDDNGVSDVDWRYLHQGGRLDTTTNLYYFRNRDYSPSLARWLEPDPIGYVDGLNVYQYEKGSPNRFRDPKGTTVNASQIISPSMAMTRIRMVEFAATAGVRRPGYEPTLMELMMLNREFDPGGFGTGKNGFLYTCRWGFIDLGHFFWSAVKGYYNDGWDYDDGALTEWIEDYFRVTLFGALDFGDSAWTPEDMPSNVLGNLFGQKYRALTAPLTVSQYFRQFLRAAGVVDSSNPQLLPSCKTKRSRGKGRWAPNSGSTMR
jgi:RHS repeat-associated protein